MADQAVDIGKFQNFWFTVILAVAYVALAIGYFVSKGDPKAITMLPDFSQEMVILLGISHAGYIAAKFPDKAGYPVTSLASSPLTQVTPPAVG